MLEEIKTVTVPDVTYKNIKEVEKILEENNLQIMYEGEIDKSKKDKIIIKEQVPSSGIKVNEGSKIFVKF